MPKDTPTPDLTPEEQLLFDMDTDRITESAQELPLLSPAAIAVGREEARQHLELHGIVLPPESPSSSSAPTILPFSRQLFIEPLASYAAADAIKSVTPWEAGVIRLLQSPMRADLAVEVLVDETRQEEFSEGLFIVRVGEHGTAIALFGNESPVFCRVYADDLTRGSELGLDWFPSTQLGPEQLIVLKKSRRNLRDPASLDRYEALIRQLESS